MIKPIDNCGAPWDELKHYQVAVRRMLNLMASGRMFFIADPTTKQEFNYAFEEMRKVAGFEEVTMEEVELTAPNPPPLNN